MDESTPLSRHPDFIRQAFLWALLPTLALFLIAPSIGDATAPDVPTAISPTPTDAGALHTIVTTPSLGSTDLCSGGCVITGGTRPGGGPNLFHSFGQFNVGSGDITTFQNGISFDLNGTPLAEGLDTSNIFARVTGSSGNNPTLSSIYGTIQTTDFGNANLFLMNPSGIVFGPHGSVDVGGSVSFSTAQYLRLFDSLNGVSANFYANSAKDGPQNNSVFAMAPVDAFGFLPTAYGFLTAPVPTATITVQGSALSVLPGQSISLVGGKVVIQGDRLPDGTVQQAAQLSAPNGTIQLASAASPGEFDVATLGSLPNVGGASFTSFGSVSLAPGSNIDVSGASTVYIKSGQIVLSMNDVVLSTSQTPSPAETISLSPGSSLVSSNSRTDPGADVQLIASNVQMDGASILSATNGDGSGGNISITSATLILTNGTQIVSSTEGPGHGGNISVTGTDSVTISGFDSGGTLSGVLTNGVVRSGIFTTSSSTGTGGDITVSASKLALDQLGTIASTTINDGQGGNITVNGGTLTIAEGGEIRSETGRLDPDTGEFVGGIGQGGNVTIQGRSGNDTAADSITLSSGASISSTTVGPGPGGNVQVTATNMNMEGPAVLTTETDGDGFAGSVALNVGTLSLIGNITGGPMINSNNFSVGSGQGGNVTIQGLQGAGSAADSVTLTNAAAITSQTFGPGRGGDILISSGVLQLDTVDIATTINSFTFNFGSGDGVGGDISLNLSTLTLMGGSVIQSLSGTSTPGIGQGGDVNIQGLQGRGSAAESVGLFGGSSLLSHTFGSGDGGQVAITSTSLTMDGAATVNSSTDADGRGGDIVVGVQQLSLSGGATIISNTLRAEADAGAGGTVTVQGLDGPGSQADSVTLSGLDTGIISETFGFARVGDIEVHARALNLTNNAVLSAGSSLDTGTAGNVLVEADSVDISGGSSIVNQTAFKDAGQVTITANDLTLDNGSIITNTSRAGRGGDVVLNVGTLSLTGSAEITSASRGTATGPAGSVTIQGRDGAGTLATSVTLTNSSLLTNAEGAGAGGDISVAASSFTLNNASRVSAATAGSKDAGQVIVTTPTLSLDNAMITTSTSGIGNAGGITADVGTLTLTNAAEISSSSTGVATGAAGSITIQGLASPADSVTLTDSSLRTSADSTGRGGSITVDATNLTLTNATISASVKNVFAADGTDGPTSGLGDIKVTSSTMNMTGGTVTVETSGARNAGDITVNIGMLTLANNAKISSNSLATASGDAGNVTVQGPGGDGTSTTSVALTNSSLLTNTEGTGAGGDIRIHAGQVQLADLALLTADTIGTGKAGRIEVTSDNLSVTGGARIQASTAGTGNAGDITITNSDTVSITGLSSDGSTRSGIFAKTQSSSGITGAGGGGGSGGGGSSQTSTAGDAGNIDLTTKNFFLSGGAQTDSSTTTSGSGGHVSVIADAITITGTSTSLRSDASRGNGKGGDIELVARTIGIHDKASVTAATDGSGNAGNISMTANESFTLDSAAIITSSTRGSGDGGTISIDSPKVLVDGPGTSITASTLRPFADLAVTLNIVHPNDGDLTVRLDSPDGTRVALMSRVGGSSDNFTGTIFDDLATRPIPTTSISAPFTGTFMPREPLGQLIDQTVAGTWKLNINDQVAGNAGGPQNLTGWSLRVGDHVFESSNVPRNIPDGGSVSSSLVVTVPAGTVVQGVGEATGDGGNVTIKAGTVTVQNGATLSATTRGSGQGGTVSVDASGGLVTLAGPGTGLFTNSEASGDSGNITVAASHMTMENGAKVSAATTSSGNAGSITAKVGTMTLTHDATISSSSTEAATGAAGSVIIQGLASPANSVTITDSSLLTSAANTGQGGSVTVSATNLALNNATVSASVNNFDNSPGSTDGATVGLGNVDLTASTMTMTDSTVTTESSGARNAGDIRINPDVAGNSFQMQNSTINTSAALADGGNIGIYATNMVRLTNSSITSSVGNETKTDTFGGNITIDPQFVILQNSQIIAQAFAGAGGAIRITATSAFIADPLSIVDASSTRGINGTVDILSPIQNVGGELTALTQEFSSAAALLAQQCAARAADGKFSTFVVAAREGLPAEPGGFLASPSLTAELLGSRLSGLVPQTQLPAITGLFPKYDAKPIQLAKLGSACHRQ